MASRIFSIDDLPSYLDRLSDTFELTISWFDSNTKTLEDVKLENPCVSTEMIYEESRYFGTLFVDISGTLTSSALEKTVLPLRGRTVHVFLEDGNRTLAFHMYTASDPSRRTGARIVHFNGYVIPISESQTDFIYTKK